MHNIPKQQVLTPLSEKARRLLKAHDNEVRGAKQG